MGLRHYANKLQSMDDELKKNVFCGLLDCRDFLKDARHDHSFDLH